MNKLQKITNLIQVRNYLSATVDNLYVKLDREQLKTVQAKIVSLDRMILDESLSLDLTQTDTDSTLPSKEDLEQWKTLFVGPDGAISRTKKKKESDA